MSQGTKVRTVLLQRHQAGHVVTPYDLEQIQENVQRALHALQALKIVSGQLPNLAAGVVGKSNIAPGSICGSVLCSSLRQGFKVAISTDVGKQTPLTNITYATQTVGAAQWSSASTLSLGTAVAMRIHARMVLGQGDTLMQPGARAQILMVDSAGNKVAAGAWIDATVDSAGTVLIYADLDEVVALSASPTTYSFQYQGQTAAGGAVANWLLKAPALGASPPNSGSFVEGIVVPQ